MGSQDGVITTGGGGGGVECCMCGDYGLLNQLFHCRVCLFRSQHRYCSNLFPTMETYRICNWCLKKDQENTDTSLASSSHSHFCNSNTVDEGEEKKYRNRNSGGGVKVEAGLHLEKGRLEMKSCELRNKDSSKKQPWKGKVRKYKLLQDVSR